MVIGCGGSGKSTFSQKLAKQLGLPLISLDQHFFEPGWKEVERTEWQEINKRLVAEPEWIIDGNYGSSMELRFARADTIIFLYLPTLTCLSRVIGRTFRHYGKTRPGMSANCPERVSFEFWHYVLMYNRTRAPKILERLKGFAGEKEIFVLRSRKEVEGFWGSGFWGHHYT